MRDRAPELLFAYISFNSGHQTTVLLRETQEGERTVAAFSVA
jgi:hypothetical protein